MEFVGIKTIQKAYAQDLAVKGDLEKASRIISGDSSSPVFEGYSVHPEEEPDIKSINKSITDIAIDIQAARAEMAHAAEELKNILDDVDTGLKSAEEKITLEEDRIKDMNIICGNSADAKTVRSFSPEELTGAFSVVGGAMTCPALEPEIVPVQLVQVTGNGYEGNAYVLYDENTFMNETDMDSSNRENISSDNEDLYYEYSRLASTGETEYPEGLNFDNLEAECAMVFYGESEFSSVKLSSDQTGLIVEDVLISKDNGVSFESVWNKKETAIFGTDKKYESGNYIYESGIISFPSTQFLKILFKSGGAESDTIAYKKVKIQVDEKTSEEIVVLKNTERHCIRLYGISAISSNYGEETTISTGELIDNPVKSISFFVNEYVPDYFSSSDISDYISYTMEINGKEYEMVPINSDRKGTKVVRKITYLKRDVYSEKLEESIKSAGLIIKMKTPVTDGTPYVSNLKICYGENELK